MNRFITIKRTEGISTSDLITRILRDYDEYIYRNLSRGAKPEDLNVSFLKAQQVKLEHQWHNLTTNISKTKDAVLNLFSMSGNGAAEQQQEEQQKQENEEPAMESTEQPADEQKEEQPAE